QLVTAFARVLAGSLPRPHHREDLTPNMNPVAPAVCEFLSESLREGFALGLDRTEGSRAVYGPWQAPPLFPGEQELEGSNASTALLVRMERREHPLRRLLEACSYIFVSALAMAAGPPGDSSAPASPTSPFKGGVVEEEGEDAGGVTAAIRGDNRATAAATTVSGGQQGWEAFNRSMDDRDEEVRKAAAAGAAAGGEKVKERELPAPMLEVLKVALSLLRRLSSRNLTAAGPFASTMQMWPSGHPQEEKGETDPERNDDGGGGGGDGDDNDDDDDGSPPAAGGAAAAAAAAAADTTAERSGTMSPPQAQAPGTPTPMAAATPMAVEPPSTPDAPSRAAGARGGSGTAATAADSTPAAGRTQSSKGCDPATISRAPGGPGGKWLTSPQDGGKAKTNASPPRFSSDLFIRRVHLLVGEVLEPLWRDPRLASLPPEAASRVLATVLELLQSLQAESSHGSVMRHRQRALARNQERAAAAAAVAGRGGRAGGPGGGGGGVAPPGQFVAQRWNFRG
ncbi:unnamed protein product, partial [Ectocarpus sp. 12 AP-2014]